MDKRSIESKFKKATLEDFINEYGQEQGIKQYQEIERIRNDYSKNEDLFGSMFSNEVVEETFLAVYGEELGTQKFDGFVNNYGEIKDILSQVKLDELNIYDRAILDFIYKMNVKSSNNVFSIAAMLRTPNTTFDGKTDLQEITTNLQNYLLYPELERKLGYENTTKIKEAIELYSKMIIEAEKLRFFAIKGLDTEKVEEFRTKKVEDFKTNLATVQNAMRTANQYRDGYNSAFLNSVSKGTQFGSDPLQVATNNLSSSTDFFNLKGLEKALEERIKFFETASVEELKDFMTNFYLKTDLIHEYNAEFNEMIKEEERKLAEVETALKEIEPEIEQKPEQNEVVENISEEKSSIELEQIRAELERRKELVSALQKFQTEFTKEQQQFIINQYMNQILVQEQQHNFESEGPKLS